MASFRDQIGHTIVLDKRPERIVSLVPSQTELLYFFRQEKEVVGITKFCIHPKEWFETKKRIGGTKKLHLEEIAALEPDLILANKEENTEAEIRWLQERFPVWTSDINSLDEALDMIEAFGGMLEREKQADELAEEIRALFTDLRQYKSQSVAYFIWHEPLMTVGSPSFIHDMLDRQNLRNVFAGQASRYPETTWQELQALNPDLIFLSSEPFPFKEEHVRLFQEKLPNSRVVQVDGEMYSWYGSRLLEAAPYFQKLHARLSTK